MQSWRLLAATQWRVLTDGVASQGRSDRGISDGSLSLPLGRFDTESRTPSSQDKPPRRATTPSASGGVSNEWREASNTRHSIYMVEVISPLV